MYKEIYEAKPFYGVNTAFMVFCIITVIIIVLLVVFWKKIDIGGRCVLSFVTVFLLFVISCQIYVAIDARREVYDKYSSGEYSTVEGYIHGYNVQYDKFGNTKYDEFYVDGIRFIVPGFVSCWGYPLTKVDGGVLEDGMHVKINYIFYKCENVIMRLEQLE